MMAAKTVPLLLLIALLAMDSAVGQLCVSNVTTFEFESFDCLRDRHLKCTGDCVSTSDGTLNLTSYDMRSWGRVMYVPGIRLMDIATSRVAYFSTNFTFSMKADYSRPGEGLAFVMQANPEYQGHSGGFLGLYNKDGKAGTSTVAIEFDTYRDWFYGFFWYNDINNNHVGVDIESINSKIQVDAGSVGIDLGKERSVTAWIDYIPSSDKPDGNLQVRIGTDPIRPVLPLITYNVDLSKHISEVMYLGFSATTGDHMVTSDCLSYHNILSWSFDSWGLGPHSPPPPPILPPPPSVLPPIPLPPELPTPSPSPLLPPPSPALPPLTPDSPSPLPSDLSPPTPAPFSPSSPSPSPALPPPAPNFPPSSSLPPASSPDCPVPLPSPDTPTPPIPEVPAPSLAPIPPPAVSPSPAEEPSLAPESIPSPYPGPSSSVSPLPPLSPAPSPSSYVSPAPTPSSPPPPAPSPSTPCPNSTVSPSSEPPSPIPAPASLPTPTPSPASTPTPSPAPSPSTPCPNSTVSPSSEPPSPTPTNLPAPASSPGSTPTPSPGPSSSTPCPNSTVSPSPEPPSPTPAPTSIPPPAPSPASSPVPVPAPTPGHLDATRPMAASIAGFALLWSGYALVVYNRVRSELGDERDIHRRLGYLGDQTMIGMWPPTR